MNRKELLESTRHQLRSIDAVVLEASNLTLAVRVDRLMDSAAKAHICCDGDCPCRDEDDEWYMPPDYCKFETLYHFGFEWNQDALRYQASITPDAMVRRDYAPWHPNEPDKGAFPIRDVLLIDHDDEELDDDDVDRILDADDDETPFVGRIVNIDGYGHYQWHVDSVDEQNLTFEAHIVDGGQRQRFHVTMITCWEHE